MYEGCRCMGGTDVYGHIDIWGRCMGHTYRKGIQMYGVYNVWGAYRCMGVYKCGGHTYTPCHKQPDIPPHECQLHMGTIFLTEFKFVPYRHILLAHQCA